MYERGEHLEYFSGNGSFCCLSDEKIEYIIFEN